MFGLAGMRRVDAAGWRGGRMVRPVVLKLFGENELLVSRYAEAVFLGAELQSHLALIAEQFVCVDNRGRYWFLRVWLHDASGASRPQQGHVSVLSPWHEGQCPSR